MKKIKNTKVVLVVLAIMVLLGGVVMFRPKTPAVSDTQTYTDTDYGFSFTYPREHETRPFSDLEDTKTILVENHQTKQGLQVFISSFDEDIVLTPDRIKKEMPDLVVLEPQNRSLGGVTGVVFRSTNALDVESYEFWIVHGGKLYQVSAPIANKSLFEEMITTWHWNE